MTAQDPALTMTTPMIHVVAAALVDAEGRVLLAQRPVGKHLAGYWEFPGGKVEPDEPPLQALRREILEEIGVEIGTAESLIRIPWHYPGKSILLDVYRVREFHGEPRSCEGQPLKWVPTAALDIHEMPPADHPVINALRLPDRYWITPQPAADIEAAVAQIDAALERGIRLIQLRAKGYDESALAALAEVAQRHVRAAGGRLLINSRIDLAESLGLDGVHLTSAQLKSCKERPLPSRFLVGASCHDTAELTAARELGVDFAVLGPVRYTPSHPDAAPLGWAQFEALCAQSLMPVYALGGMHLDDLESARRYGGQGIAGISGF
ncbi:Nudix family hydrolase [Tahibacter amnicola]|uniref:8-oxo-dGTP diphosphatase n=1 Tax=Tahibacter amnicola TaxID=2976241 RepID=A0ABY6BGH0_9GAMM|nr:Nudix family hydrolase [Tahibacter amnicola]UXI67706.1 Nudix family hydrolase [Tahibacter amnicola]